MAAYRVLNRFDEAKAAAQKAQSRNLDSPGVHYELYSVDFVQHDAPGMEHQGPELMGKPGWEDLVLYFKSDAAACSGQFVKARELTRRAADSARLADENETAAGYEAEAALREALAGNFKLAKRRAQAALGMSKGRDGEAISAIALGLAGDSKAWRLPNDLSKRFPKDTMVRSEYLPMVRAATILGGSNAAEEGVKAVESLELAAPYELGSPAEYLNFNLYPVYLRGQAYLAARRGDEAAAEFKKILDHSSVVLSQPIGALARLGLGRAYALEASARTGPPAARSSDGSGRPEDAFQNPDSHAKALNAYQEFLALWRRADPDVPVLIQARSEYAKLALPRPGAYNLH